MSRDLAGAVRLMFADLDLSDPGTAFAYGLALGMAYEREASDAVDDVAHRRAVRAAITVIDQADRRRAFDRGRAA